MVPEQAKRGGGLRIGRALKHPLTEGKLIQTIAARIHIEIGRRAHQPRSINRTVNAARQWRLVGSGHAGVHVERGRPERTTGWGSRRSCAVGPNAQQKKGEVAQRARKRMVGLPPLVVAAHTRCGQRSESLDSLIVIRQPQAEGKRGGRRRRRIDHVVQVGESPIVLAEQLADERVWRGHRGVNRRFPEWNSALTSRRHDSSLMNPQVVAKCGKRRRSPLVQIRHQRRVLDEVVQRLIVESGETSTE